MQSPMTTRANLFLTLLGCLCLTLCASPRLSAAIIYVNANASGNNTGLNWTNAYNDLQSALTTASSGDQIWVAAGVYKPTSTNNRDIAFEIPSGVSLFGGFLGIETTLNQRDWVANGTVLSGAIGNQADITDNTRVLIRVSDAPGTVQVNGFKIRRAYQDATNAFYFVNSNNVIFSKCEFNLNASALWQFRALTSNLTFNDCLIHTNTAQQLTFADLTSTLTFNNCTVAGNALQFGMLNAGGSSTQLNNCIVWQPGVTNSSMLTVNNCIVSDPQWQALGQNNLLSDPLFVAPNANNYRLQATSPAIDMGSTSFVSQGYDLDRNLRIYGVAPDAGCYEARVPTRIYVDVDAVGINNGADWANAFNDLQQAIAMSIPGDVIWVAEGTYYPTTGTSRGANFFLPHSVELIGGFNGTETNRNQRDWQTNLTILSADIGVPNDLSDNCYHVVRMALMNADYLLDGFVIQDGNANSGSLNGEGGGITIQGANSAVVQNCLIRNNYGNSGGGLHVLTSPNNVVIQQSIFQNNTGGTGAAIYFANDPVIRSCLFYQNSASNEGIVFVEEDAALLLNNCTFYLNVLQSNGAHVIDGQGSGSPWLITNSIFWFNSHPNNVAAIYNQGASAAVSHCIFQNAAYNGNQSSIYVGAPLFVNPLADNFALQSNSPGMNAGDNSQVVETLDALGNTRIRFGNVDIGAIEGDFTPPGVVFVDLDATGNNDGSSWTDAFTDLGDALDYAQAGEAIWVAEGTYFSPGQGANGAVLWQIPDGVALLGGFNGTEWDAAQAEPLEHETIISGNAGNLNVSTDNVSGLLACEESSIGVRIAGFTFQDVYRLDTFGRSAIFIYNDFEGEADLTQVVIENCVFRDNYSEVSASCISLSVASAALGNQASVEVNNCLFYHNTGADALIQATISNACFIEINNCTFTENSLIDPLNLKSLVSGFIGTEITIENTIFWNNVAPEEMINFADVSHSLFQITNIAGTNNLQGDPRFVDPVNLDFSLRPNSPVIGRGDNSLVSTSIDLIGGDRVQEGTVDLGCIESPYPAFEGIIYVDIDATGNNNGTSWQDAFNDLGDALHIAAEGDRIWLAEGTYISPGLTFVFDPIWQLPDGVALIGGFSGNETEEAQAAPWLNESIISGNAGNPDLQTDNTSGLLGCFDSNNGTYLYGLVFEDNYNEVSSGRPALMIFNNTDPESDVVYTTVENCIFRNNVSLNTTPSCALISVEAAALGNQASLQMENCLFVGNTGTGGLIAATIANACTIALNNCTLTENSLIDVNNLRPLISGFSGTVIDITNTIFWNNAAPKDFSVFANVSYSIYTNNPLGGSNNLQVDPLFVDASNGNFSLSANSPAMDTGNNSFVTMAVDLSGNTRIQEGTVDRGGFEGVQEITPETCLGDFDNDGFISAGDLLNVLGALGTSCGSPYCGADLTGDGVVDISDLLTFFALFGTACN